MTTVKPAFPGPFGGPNVMIHHASGWQWALATVLRFVAVLLIIAAIVYLVRAFILSRPRAGQFATPWRSPGLDELDMRYARGEVTRTEYFERRNDLLGATAAPPQPTAEP